MIGEAVNYLKLYVSIFFIYRVNSMRPTNLRSVDLNLLPVFDAIYQARNMSRAAERLGMSQPAISLALGRLRDLLDDPLFVRGRGAMQPTARALQLAGPIRGLLDTVVSTVLREPAFDYISSDRKFALALGDYGACTVLPRLAQQLEEMGAGVRLHCPGVTADEAELALASGSLDLLLTAYLPTDTDLRSQLVMTDTAMMVARPGHPAVREGMSAEQYCELPHVIPDWPRGKGLRPGEENLLAHTLRRREFMHVHSFLAMPAIIAQTDGVGSVPMRLARHFAETYGLKIWPLPAPIPVPIYLTWHRKQEDDAGHQWMRHLIGDLFARM